MSHYKETTRKGYLYAEAFKGKDVDLTIKSWKEHKQKGEDGDEYLTEITFDETTKKLLVNTVNSESISELSSADGDRDAWPGLTVTFYPIRGKFFGSMRNAIRVRSKLPSQKRDKKAEEETP